MQKNLAFCLFRMYREFWWVLINSPAPFYVVIGLNIFTQTQTLMSVCGWMSVRQLLVYHSLVLFHKTLMNKTPVYLHKKIEEEPIP